jgi:hypothetical protein
MSATPMASIAVAGLCHVCCFSGLLMPQSAVHARFCVLVQHPMLMIAGAVASATAGAGDDKAG